MRPGETLLTALQHAGWQVKLRPSPGLLLSPEIRERYPGLPEDVEDFLARFESCVSPDEKSWFWSQGAYNGEASMWGFQWNECEKTGRQLAGGDPAKIVDVMKYWKYHFPIAITIGKKNHCLATCIAPDHFGAVVYCKEPTFLNGKVVAASFTELALRTAQHLKGARTEILLEKFFRPVTSL